jgi:hypothetical protein
MSAETLRAACEESVDALDALLVEKPDNIDEAMIQATQCVVRLRDRCIERCRAGDAKAGERLREVNSVLSLVIGSHYTLIGLRWKRIEKAREALKALYAESQSA